MSRIVLTARDDAVRIDKYISLHTNLTRSAAAQLIAKGRVLLDGEKVTDIAATFAKEDFEGEGKVLRRGKKNFRKVLV